MLIVGSLWKIVIFTIIWMPDNMEIDTHSVTIEISSDINKAKLKISIFSVN